MQENYEKPPKTLSMTDDDKIRVECVECSKSAAFTKQIGL